MRFKEVQLSSARTKLDNIFSKTIRNFQTYPITPQGRIKLQKKYKGYNEGGLTTEEGHIQKNINVYWVLKRYLGQREPLKIKKKRYPLIGGKIWMEFIN